MASQATRRAVSPSSQAPPSPVLTDAAARCPAHRARYPAIHASCNLESTSSSHKSAKVTCTRALTGCPARCGSRPEASSRFIASASASWYRCGLVRRSPPPFGADSASRTAWTIAAHSGVRSPRMTPAPSRVVSRNTARSSAGSRPSGSGGTVRDRISAQICASARRSAPARAAATRISSAWARNSAGIAWVHLASCRACDLVTALVRSPASSGSWSPGQGPHGLVLGGLAPG